MGSLGSLCAGVGEVVLHGEHVVAAEGVGWNLARCLQRCQLKAISLKLFLGN